MRFIAGLLLLSLAGLSAAQVIGFGGCPPVHPVDLLDVNGLIGRWYEIAKFYTVGDNGNTCQRADYNVSKDGSLLMNFTGNDVLGRRYNSTGVATREPNAMDGRITVRTIWPMATSEYIVVAVDYENFLMTHGCKEYFYGWINLQYNWIMSRSPMMSGRDYRTVLAVAAEQGINVAKFLKTMQEGCVSDDGDDNGGDRPDDGSDGGSDGMDGSDRPDEGSDDMTRPE